MLCIHCGGFLVEYNRENCLCLWCKKIVEKREKANMKEMEGMKEAFNIFVDSCEKAGVKFSKEEKQVEEWPKVGDDYWFRTNSGECWVVVYEGSLKNIYQLNNIITFKTKESCEKYYSIIDTKNEIVDELGRPTWEDFEDIRINLFTISFDSNKKELKNTACRFCFQQNTFSPYCKKPYLEKLLEKVSENDLLWAFKKSMRLV